LPLAAPTTLGPPAGIYDDQWTTVVTRGYNNFQVWPFTPEAVLFASTSAELRTEGYWRNDLANAVRVRSNLLEGDLPRIPPAALESRSAELFMKLSEGSIYSGADTLDNFTVQPYVRPCYLFRP
jgi:hypothetical protein